MGSMGYSSTSYNYYMRHYIKKMFEHHLKSSTNKFFFYVSTSKLVEKMFSFGPHALQKSSLSSCDLITFVFQSKTKSHDYSTKHINYTMRLQFDIYMYTAFIETKKPWAQIKSMACQ